MDQEKFDAALKTFFEGCREINHDYMKRQCPTLSLATFSMTHGKRYTKILTSREADGSGGGSVHCFVDRTNGDVLKPASWKAPAKHARGNIFDEHNGLGKMGQYGPAYLR